MTRVIVAFHNFVKATKIGYNRIITVILNFSIKYVCTAALHSMKYFITGMSRESLVTAKKCEILI
jgi:hypothetical protein